ncbi:hypothetical protein RUM44_004161 [Polyplax serrata]|uniref:Carboxylesterase type B domain-containing protein n=1 Tax=Polyplax serrata TaxID=468196 RepID=A0ABR1B227_POLSC
MILIESKWFGFITPDRFLLADGINFRFFAITFVFLVQIIGRLASTDTIDYLVDGRSNGKIKIGNLRLTDRFMRDVNDKARIDNNNSDEGGSSSSSSSGGGGNSGGNSNMNLPYQNFRDSNGRFSPYPDTDAFLDKFKSMPLKTRIVRTKYGDLSGIIVSLDSRHLEPVEVFRGVPYAMPPTGSLRFMPPVSGALWSGVKHADKFSPVCPQRLPDISNETIALKRMPKGRLDYLKRLLPYLQNQSEDCLYLNIYAPAQAGSREQTGSRKYPVLLFVHGESYEWNSGNAYDGSVLASYGGLVVVTVNYRLGILGEWSSDPEVRFDYFVP